MPHIHDKVDFTVEVFIVRGARVLLRKHDKYKIWLSVGGHIELDEDPVQAAIREVKEETGLDITLYLEDAPFVSKDEPLVLDKNPPRFMYRHNINATHEHVCFVYFARADSDIIDEAKLQEDETPTEMHWFTMGELSKKEFGITDRVRFYASRALDTLQD